jgi:hypothetical protein
MDALRLNMRVETLILEKTNALKRKDMEHISIKEEIYSLGNS